MSKWVFYVSTLSLTPILKQVKKCLWVKPSSSDWEYNVVIIRATGKESCHLQAGLGWAVWEATTSSCWAESLFIVSSLAQRLRKLGSPAHTHIAAGSSCSRHGIQPQGSPGSPFRVDLTNKETLVATRTAGKIPMGPQNQTPPVKTFSIQCLPQTKPQNPESALNPTQ